MNTTMTKDDTMGVYVCHNKDTPTSKTTHMIKVCNIHTHTHTHTHITLRGTETRVHSHSHGCGGARGRARTRSNTLGTSIASRTSFARSC